MRFLEWLFIPTLAGYLLLVSLNATRYRTLHASGYHLFFQSAFFGILLAVAAFGINIFLLGVPKPNIPDIGLVIFPLALLLPTLLNLRDRPGKAARRTAEKTGDLIELLLDEALRRELFVEISLRHGKAYISTVLESGLGNEDSDIALIPLLSGYRDQDTQELTVTIEYGDAIQQAMSELDLDLSYFRVVMPMGEVVSVRIFDPDVATIIAAHQPSRITQVLSRTPLFFRYPT